MSIAATARVEMRVPIYVSGDEGTSTRAITVYDTRVYFIYNMYVYKPPNTMYNVYCHIGQCSARTIPFRREL